MKSTGSVFHLPLNSSKGPGPAQVSLRELLPFHWFGPDVASERSDRTPSQNQVHYLQRTFWYRQSRSWLRHSMKEVEPWVSERYLFDLWHSISGGNVVNVKIIRGYEFERKIAYF